MKKLLQLKLKIFINLTWLIAIIILIAPLIVFAAAAAVNGSNLAARLKGKIVLQVQSKGEAWYINPQDSRRYFLGRPEDAYNLMRALGIGIKNSDLEKIPVSEENFGGVDADSDGLSDVIESAFGTNPQQADTDGDGFSDKEEILNNYSPLNNKALSLNRAFANKHLGKIFLQVEAHGEAWYVNPDNGQRYFLGRPNNAFAVMKNTGLGITNNNLNIIPVRTFTLTSLAQSGNRSDNISSSVVDNINQGPMNDMANIISQPLVAESTNLTPLTSSRVPAAIPPISPLSSVNNPTATNTPIFTPSLTPTLITTATSTSSPLPNNPMPSVRVSTSTPLSVTLNITQEPENLNSGALVAVSDGEIINCLARLGARNVTGRGNHGVGILVSGHSNVIVRNCAVSGFYFGLFANNANGLKIENSSFNNNATLTVSDVYSTTGGVGEYIYTAGANYPIKTDSSYRQPFAPFNSYVVNDNLNGVLDRQFIMLPKEAIDTSRVNLAGKPIYYYDGFIGKIAKSPYLTFPGKINKTQRRQGGGGIIIQNSSGITVSNVTASNNFSGLELYNVSSSRIENSQLDHNFGFGIFMHASAFNTVASNNLSYTRYPSEWRQWDGTDNAALMMMHGSSNNNITGNNFSYSPDGLFLSADDGNTSYPTSDNNLITNNIATYSEANAFEVVFSRNNVLTNNTASYSKYGFWATYGDGLKINDNILIGNSNAGVEIHMGKNYEVTGNTIRQTGRELVKTGGNFGLGINIINDSRQIPFVPAWISVFNENSNIIVRNNIFNDNKSDIFSDPLSAVVASAAADSPTCDTLVSGSAPHPYVITFMGDGFANTTTVRDNFIPLCTGQIGNLNPISTFPTISKNTAVPNLGIFSREPFQSNSGKFTIQYVNSLNNNQTLGCQSNGTGCNYAAIKDRALAVCPNTNMVIFFKNDSFFGWTTANGPDPFASGNIPLIAIGVSASPDRITNEHWGVCTHEFGHAFGFLADEVSGTKTLAETGYENNRDSIANCALPSECTNKFGSGAQCIPGCGGSNYLSRPSQNSIMYGIDLSIASSLVFNTPSVNRLNSLLQNTFFGSTYQTNTSGSTNSTSVGSLPLTAPTSVVSAPTFIYPQNGQELAIGGSYGFKVQAVSGADAYRFRMYQNNTLIYDNERDDYLSPNGEWAIHTDNAKYSQFQVGSLEVRAAAIISGNWGTESSIIITLK